MSKVTLELDDPTLFADQLKHAAEHWDDGRATPIGMALHMASYQIKQQVNPPAPVRVLNSVAGKFQVTTEDLESLASGVVPEWLRYDADAALDWPKDAEPGVPGLAAQGNHEIPKAPIGFCQKTRGCHGSNTHEGGCWTS